MCFPVCRPSSTAPWMAQLSPSLPQEVKKSSSGLQPRAAASWARCAFTCSAARVPRAYREEGLPQPSVMASTAAWTASGRTGVVAALSK